MGGARSSTAAGVVVAAATASTPDPTGSDEQMNVGADWQESRGSNGSCVAPNAIRKCAFQRHYQSEEALVAVVGQ